MKEKSGNMDFIKSKGQGLLLCFAIAVPAAFLGKAFPVVGGPVFAIITGMILAILIKDKSKFSGGITYTSKKILQYAVILLGFGLNLSAILKTGKESLPIIISTISVALIVAFICCKAFKIPGKISTLIGVGSSICGGSAIAATAPVIDADDQEVAQAISVVFFFNVLAALIFPYLGVILGFSQVDGNAFGLFAGTAVNDTSSVTATASSWDSMFGLGTQTLDTAVMVKLTRTLAIIPITLGLAFYNVRRAKKAEKEALVRGEESIMSVGGSVSIKKIFPFFILYFIGASIITTISTAFLGVPVSFFTPFKSLSKFFIIMAMAAIGLNTDIVKLLKSGGKPLMLGLICWICVMSSSLVMQHVMGIW